MGPPLSLRRSGASVEWIVRIALIAVGTVAALGAAAALGARALPGESWVGSQYGWTTDPPERCKPRRDVCATEDGGASWHGIFNGGTFVFGVVRTSRTAGAVSTGRQVAERFWTRDNGRHWYRTRKIGPEFQGSGTYLFWIDFGPTLYRVNPWPPGAKARCRGAWTAAAFDTKAVKGGNVCSGAPVDAGMRSSAVVRLEEGKLAGLSNIPGGVIATVTASPVPRVLIYRLGRPRVVDLPAAGALQPCVGFNSEPIVSWPRITVLACGGAAGDPSGTWVSSNGGASWRVIPGP
jgi:hypothetical protein